MNKRSITGWRQVPPAALSLRKRSRAVAPSPIAVHAVAEPPPKAQWETEGGTVAAPAKQVRK